MTESKLNNLVIFGREFAESIDFENARDRIMMGIERKNLTMDEKTRLQTAIHEAGHALTAYFTKDALKLYKATIVSRGGSLGAVSNALHLIMADVLRTE